MEKMEVLKQRLQVEVDLAEARLSGETTLHLTHKRNFYPSEWVGGGEEEDKDAQEEKVKEEGGNGEEEKKKAKKKRRKKSNRMWREWGKEIALNCRQCEVKAVHVNGIPVNFSLRDSLKKVVPQKQVRDLYTFYGCFAGSLLASNDGELVIELPSKEQREELRVQKQKDRQQESGMKIETKEGEELENDEEDDFDDGRELVVRIQFEVPEPRGGVRFAACGNMITNKREWENNDYSFTRGTNHKTYYSHMFTCTSLCGAETTGAGSGARCWFPCVDRLQARCPFSLQVKVSKKLRVIAGGKFVGERFLPDGKSKIVSFEHEDPIAPHNLGLCVGPFQKFSYAGSDTVEMYHLPSAPIKTVEKADVHLRKSIKEMVEFLRLENFTFKTYRQVFVDHEFASSDIAPFSAMSLVSDALLLPENEPTPDTPAGAGLLFDKSLNFVQAQGVGYNFFGCLVPPKSESDIWLISGLSMYLAYRYALKAWKLVKIQLPTKGSMGINQIPSKPAATGDPKDFFVTSCDPRELLLSPFEALTIAKKRFEKVSKQLGTSGNVLQRPLRQPSRSKHTVDSLLWSARGFDHDCLFSRRAFFTIHTLERLTNQGAGVDDEYGASDVFSDILHQYIANAVEENMFFETLRTSFWNGQSPPKSAPFVRERIPLRFSSYPQEDELGDPFQKMTHEDKTLFGINEYDFVLKMCAEGGLKPSEFNVYKSDNFADNWLNKCSFLELQGSVEYKNNNLELMMVQNLPREGSRPMSLALRIRVVEEDDTWQHERVLAKERASYTIQLHAQKQRQRGGRKSQSAKVKINKWENPQSLKTSELLLLFYGAEEEERIWHNEFPVKYVILDPEIVWARHVQWKQTEIMFLELLSDPMVIMDDVLQQCFAFDQMARLSTQTDGRSGENGAANGSSSSSSSSSGPSSMSSTALAGSGAANGTSLGDKSFDLRCACAIAGCMVDYRRPPRVRAEALMRLVDWQNYHQPKRAAYDKDDGSKIEDRPGSHPWVGLNMILVAMRKTMFSSSTGKLLPNDFGVPGELAVKRVAARALKRLAAESGKPPDEVLDMVLVLLRDNDNSVNNWSDALYLHDLNEAAGSLLAQYLVGTHHEEHREDSAVERVGQTKTVQQVLGKYYEIVDHIKRYLHYDAVAPSPNHIITAGCLKALSTLEYFGVISPSTPFFAYAVFQTAVPPANKEASVAAAHDWGALVREEAFKAILTTYIDSRDRDYIFKFPTQPERNRAWLDVLKWVLENVSRDPCPQLQWNVVKFALGLHADTIEIEHEELENNVSPSGVFWPLSNTKSDIDPQCRQPTKDLADLLWGLFNEHNDCDGRLRLAYSQLYRAIWGLDSPRVFDTPLVKGPNLGPFKGWNSEPDEYFSPSPAKKKPKLKRREGFPSPSGQKRVKVVLKLKKNH